MNPFFSQRRDRLLTYQAMREGKIPSARKVPCHQCGEDSSALDWSRNRQVCPRCGFHKPIGAYYRLSIILDPGTFQELEEKLEPADPLNFPGYPAKLAVREEETGLRDAAVAAVGKIMGRKAVCVVLDSRFFMGSMGTAVGEKITRLFEYATEHGMSVVGYTVSGGARMQEGLLSLMQMAKTSGAVLRHSQAGLFYCTVLTDPTTGGVTASFAMEGDIILAEPGATVGFAGARVVEQTTRKALPKGFQTAEFLLKHGFVDAIVPRRDQQQVIAALLQLHGRGGSR